MFLRLLVVKRGIDCRAVSLSFCTNSFAIYHPVSHSSEVSVSRKELLVLHVIKAIRSPPIRSRVYFRLLLKTNYVSSTQQPQFKKIQTLSQPIEKVNYGWGFLDVQFGFMF